VCQPDAAAAGVSPCRKWLARRQIRVSSSGLRAAGRRGGWHAGC